MKVTDIDFRAMLDFRPQEGKILFGSERMLIFRQAAFGVLRGLLFERLGVELTNSMLSQFGYRCGKGDYEALMGMFAWNEDVDRIAAGPAIHSWEGLVLARPERLDFDFAEGTCHFCGTWESSYEAEMHVEHMGTSGSPVCFTLAGYASGYSSAFMNRPVICVETECVAAGDAVCRFEVRPEEAWDARADPHRRALEATDSTIHKQLERSLAQLSTPILRVWDGVLALPIVGALDARRTATITQLLLEEVARTSTQIVILDVTGVEAVDDATASALLGVVSAVELLGARCHLSGVRGEVARALSTTSLDLGRLRTFATVQQALRQCLPRRRDEATRLV